MNRFRHILLVVALLVAAMPCTHAVGHDHHGAEDTAPSLAAGGHLCQCHGCEPDVCSDPWMMPREQVTPPLSAEVPTAVVRLAPPMHQVLRLLPKPPRYRYVPMPMETVLLLI